MEARKKLLQMAVDKGFSNVAIDRITNDTSPSIDEAAAELVKNPHLTEFDLLYTLNHSDD